MNLVEKAKAIKRIKIGRVIDQDLLNLALAWAKGEVTISQAEMATRGKIGGMQVYVDFARCFRELVRQGRVR